MSIFKSTLYRSVIAVTLLFAFCAVGCGGEKPRSTPEPSDQITIAEETRVLGLAEAFRLFGEFDIESGVNLSSLEYIIYCMYTTKLEESHVEGYGEVSVSEADATMFGVFGSFTYSDMLRTAFDSRIAQEYFYLDGNYYIKLSGSSEYSYEIVGHSHTESGESYTVDVYANGEAEMRLVLSLLPADSETDIYRVKKCEIQLWK